MVLLNGLKYACETCIKGHRSSACSHTDRTLFEIKKKGRPITQCEHCRHLRKTRQVHVKCLCGTRPNGEKSNGTRAKLKLPTAATIRLDPDDPTHATITAGPGLLPPKTKVVKPKSKLKECCKTAETTKSCNTRPSSPSLPSAPVTPPPPSAAPTSSCCSSKAKSHPSDNHSSKSATTGATAATAASSTSNDDNYTASLLDDLSRSAARSANTAAAPAIDPYHHHVQPFYNPSLSANSFAWQSGVNLGSCSCGITCACPGCYEHSLSTSMILFSGENCPYSCTTCTACNGFGVTSHMPNAFILPSHPTDHWRQPSSSAIVSAAPFIPPHASSSSAPEPEKSTTTSVSRCCGGPCRCIVCNCDKAKDGEEIPERIGFAVSGERGGCCTDTNPRIRYRPPDDDHEADSSASSETSRDSSSRDDYRPATTFSMQGNPATAQIQMHSIDVPKLVA